MSNGCRDARSVRPLCQRLQQPLVLTGTDAQVVRPDTGLLVSLCRDVVASPPTAR